ncbi:WG repeat-containing protein, partial [Chryseobacterium sp. Leaf201]|uniref:WG repeat-containing protein n=1 Tax=Chryseobacterium sp. Leaf201 TaxID=1735672 RepID=UPI000B32CE98
MKNIVYCLLMILFFSCEGQNKNEVFLLPYQVGEKWGLADTLGNIKVHPQYDEVIDFNIEPLQFAKTPPYSYYYVRKNKEIFL